MKYYATPHRFLRHMPTLPFIYMAVFPMILMDFWVELYHRVCFPFYRIAYVKRREYIKTDRHRLKYLNIMQKINCFYCGYANGLVRYWVKIFAETEAYWCGIQHQKSENFKEPEHHADFLPYGDEKAYRETFANDKTNKF
jgi:hypothetical protein